MEEINLKVLKKHLDDYKRDKTNSIIRHALSANSLKDVTRSKDDISDVSFHFDIELNTLPVTNQKASGRCWIFAATNIVREHIASDLKLPDFEVSQSYLAFYDRLEKSNYLLEAIIELLGNNYDERVLSYLLCNGISDGGQWDMIVSLVEKYGLCPKDVYPETFNSSNTRETNSLINFNIRKFASDANSVFKAKGVEAVKKLKNNVLTKIFELLVSCYGIPPEKFDFEYTNKEGNTIVDKNLTPNDFKSKYIGDLLTNYVSLINAPTKSKPFGKTYTIKYLGNVIGGKDIIHLNVPMKRLNELIVTQLSKGDLVWFGSDVSNYGEPNEGIWDDKTFDYLTPFKLDFKMDKGESLDYRASQMNHAMCITGVSLKGKTPRKWKIENSWGSDRGNKGYYVMSSTFFDSFVYQAVIKKELLNEEEKKALEQNPIILKPWDPMGSLA